MTPDLRAAIERGERELSLWKPKEYDFHVSISLTDLRLLLDAVKELERDAEGLRRKYEKAHVGELQSLTCIFRSWVADELHVYDCDEDRAYAQHLLDRIDAALAKEQP